MIYFNFSHCFNLLYNVILEAAPHYNAFSLKDEIVICIYSKNYVLLLIIGVISILMLGVTNYILMLKLYCPSFSYIPFILCVLDKNI
ncbi:hypothetical protein EXW31_14355 [Bacillus mycoides]|nr:hypothetical protein EXW31_14355 [Bacillus mycoides]